MPSVSNPMQQAVYRGCVECLRMLVESPPFYSVDACCGTDGLRPIHIAAREGHIQTLRFLSSAGACLQRADLGGCTALHHAASAGQLRAVRWLLRHGAKILLDLRGRSPIQVAADYDHMEIVNVLAKHTTTVIPSSLNSATSNTSESIEEHCDSRISRRSSAQTSEKDTTGSVDDYSFNTESSHSRRNHQHHNKPFSHLHVEPQTQGESRIPEKNPNSPGDCASSSGNSSLSASTSAPSLSPSSSSAVSGCSTSDETTLVKSGTDVSDTFTLEDYTTGSYSGSTSTGGSSLVAASPSPFFLHPPHHKDFASSSPSSVTSSTTQRSEFSNDGGVEVGKGILKKSNHKRQNSTALSSSSPFFLHPPENLVSETQKAVQIVGKMAPAPVNSSHSHHHHFADPSFPESTPKLKVGLAESCASSSTSSPPHTPPGTKSGMSTTISECISKFQAENGKRGDPCNGISIYNKTQNPGDVNVKTRNQINTNNIPPPPPPPPPMPSNVPITNSSSGSDHPIPSTPTNKHSCPLPNLPKDAEHRQARGSAEVQNKKDSEQENDYEDIEEVTNSKVHFEQTRKLLRSVSAPTPSDETINNNNNPANLPNDEEQNDEEGLPHLQQTYERSPIKPPLNGSKLPFIPPHFPTQPSDALIKPSEYLRSIQNKSKTGGNHSTRHQHSQQSVNSSRVEETMKALGVPATVLMSPVPEETNAEDEFEEINPERMINNGGAKMNGESNLNGFSSPHYNSTHDATIDENNNNGNSNNSHHPSATATTTTIKGCGGMIKAEELMKVNLRKTPMSRTKSAPPLGRVIPDENVTVEREDNDQIQNGHEPLKRTTTMSPTFNNGGGLVPGSDSGVKSVSKADVIAELAQSSQVGGVREWKQELLRRAKEQDKAVQKEIDCRYQPVNFVSEVPSQDVTGVPIPDWKRQMMARKAAERAKKEAEEQRRLEIEAKRQASIPMWRKQLLQRRESDAKYAQ